MTRIVVIAVGCLVLLWTAVTALTQVEAGERAVVRRFGRVLPHRPGPGLYCGLPWGMERVDRVPVGKARRVSVGFTGKEDDDPAGTPAGQLLTGDHNLVNVQVEVYYKVNEAEVEKFALQSDRVDPLLARLSVRLSLSGLWGTPWTRCWCRTAGAAGVCAECDAGGPWSVRPGRGS